MKLYLNPRCGASRSILMFFHEHESMAGSCDVALVSRPGRADRSGVRTDCDSAPMLVDGDLVLRRAPAILRYLAGCYASPTYPILERSRARIDGAMDWVHAELARDPCHADAQTQADAEKLGFVRADARLKQLDTHLRVQGFPYLCGDEISIADYAAAGMLGHADAAGLGLADRPRVMSWLRLMKSRPSWAPTHFAMPGRGSTLSRSAWAA